MFRTQKPESAFIGSNRWNHFPLLENRRFNPSSGIFEMLICKACPVKDMPKKRMQHNYKFDLMSRKFYNSSSKR